MRPAVRLRRSGLHIAACLTISAVGLHAQETPRLEIQREDGSTRAVMVQFDRGYASVAVATLEELGWRVAEENGALILSGGGEITVSLRFDSPYFRWDGVVLQMADAPYRAGGTAWLPLQFVTDFLPRRLPGLYDFVGAQGLLRAGDVSLLAGEDSSSSGASVAGDRDSTEGMGIGSAGAGASAEDVRNAGRSVYEGVRVVVIDAGHGGEDPGALSPSGMREKTVALAIAREVEASLRDVPDLEVHMIRDDDSFVDVWDRGQRATDWKGERPGIFVSIHANSFPARRAARGFETYFLSDARTEHERRVSAIENAPLNMSASDADEDRLADLDFILRDLRNYEHAHWSENLAGLVQAELDHVHPGPNRGVKQGVLAVLTNALMPSVLIEVGYLSNDNEARLLGDADFHRESGLAIAEAVIRFFDRYPPGSRSGGGTGSK